MEHVLEETLSTILVQLADFFGTTTAAIQAQLPHFLAEYGRYYTLTEIPWYVFCGTFISVLVSLGWGGIYYLTFELTKMKPFIIGVVIIAIITYFLAVGVPIITCLVAPELVGIEAIFTEFKLLTS